MYILIDWHLYLKEEAWLFSKKVYYQLFCLKIKIIKSIYFYPLLYSSLQKFLCHLKSFKFSRDLILKYIPVLQLCPFHYIIAFVIVFVTYGVWLALIVLFLIGSCLCKTLKKISKTWYIWWNFCNSFEFLNSVVNFSSLKSL